MASFRFSRWCAAGLVVGILTGAAPPDNAPPPRKLKKVELPPPPSSILDPATSPIDLPSALKLAGVQNAEILLAQNG